MEPPSNQSDLSREAEALREAWMRHDDVFLKDYLVSDVEDPRIHFPSILSRGLVAELLFPGKYRALIWEEYRFGICMSYLRRVFQQRPSSGTPGLLLEAITNRRDSFQSIVVPSYFHDSWKFLCGLPDHSLNYIAEGLSLDVSHPKKVALNQNVLNTFQKRWRGIGLDMDCAPLKVMEPACGSANDYRFMHAFGFSQLMHYQGFDICPKNISNARELFPGVPFEEGSVFDIPAGDREQDYLLVHDLFEHLSLDGMYRGLEEVCRVTRGTACLCFFNMAERSDHVVVPKDGYHWNRLSLEKVCHFLESRCQQLQVIHVSSFLRQAFGCDDYHNSGAYALVLDFKGK